MTAAFAACGGQVDAPPPEPVTASPAPDYAACIGQPRSTYPSPAPLCQALSSRANPCVSAAGLLLSTTYACGVQAGSRQQPRPDCFDATPEPENKGNYSFLYFECADVVCAPATDASCSGTAYLCPAGTDMTRVGGKCAVNGLEACCKS